MIISKVNFFLFSVTETCVVRITTDEENVMWNLEIDFSFLILVLI